MKIRKIASEEGYYLISEKTDINSVNPIEHFKESFITTRVVVESELLLLKDPTLPKNELTGFLKERALLKWNSELEKITSCEVPPAYISLLNSKSKKEQVQLLQGQSITTSEFRALIVKAYTDFGYTYSQFSSEHLPKGIKEEFIPKVVELKKDEIKKVGETSLTDGQLKQVINHRNVVVANFLNHENSWHCFFITYKSINGEEKWKDGQPHFHYISDKFGLSRERVESSLKSEKYQLGSLPHIDLIRYENQK